MHIFLQENMCIYLFFFHKSLQSIEFTIRESWVKCHGCCSALGGSLSNMLQSKYRCNMLLRVKIAFNS